MRRTQKQVGLFLKFGTFLSTLGFVACTLVQIYARFFMEKAPSWTEAAARIFFVFAIGFSSGLAMKGNYYVHFDFLFEKLGPKWKSFLKKAILASTILLFLILSGYSLQFITAGWMEKSPSLNFPMAIPFASVLVMGLSITFYAALKLWTLLKNKGTK